MESSTLNANTLSIVDFIKILKKGRNFLKLRLKKITIAFLLGGIFGFCYAIFTPNTYSAKTTFIVEDAKSGGNLSGLASLAGQFGFDLGASSGGGLIAGDNILLYIKSESLIRKVLLSSWDSVKKTSFIDKYIEVYKLKKKWSSEEELVKLSYPITTSNNNLSRVADSILQVITEKIILEEITINKIDKKAGFLQLKITMRNEQLAKRFCDDLINEAIKYYMTLKVGRQLNTVNKLQLRADSISRLLNQRTFTSANLQNTTAVLDQNPIYKTPLSVAVELSNRDKVMLSTIYVEVVKNLELAKFSLSQETPVFQLVDQSTFPLIVNKASKAKWILIGSILTGLICIIYLFIKAWIKKQSTNVS